MNHKAGEQNPCRQLQILDISPMANDRFWHLRLQSPDWSWTPGQFLMLRSLSWGHDPLGARPFSIADQNQDGLHIYMQVLGKATRSLARLSPGEEVLVWGPLGRGFHLEPELPALLLAGGMGLAPLVGLINHHPHPRELELIFGHRQDLGNYPFSHLAERVLAWDVQDRTEKDLMRLQRAVEVKINGYAPDGRVLACGPEPFLRMVQSIALQAGAQAQLCLEKYMACGIGACLGCVVENSQGEHVQSCIQGPVFPAQDIRI
ncbi:MAG: dihydroorotate dehydrogenase electron transfer subunit [Desulfohalobiaceae bacterium]